MIKFPASVLLAFFIYLNPVSAQQDLGTALRAFETAPTEQAAEGVAQTIMALTSEGQWDAVAVITPEATRALLDRLSPGLGAELLLLTVQAKGAVGDADARDALIKMADVWGTRLPDEAARELSINLGYILLQTGAPEAALVRLRTAMQEAERDGRGADLMNLCGLGTDTFDRFGHADQAAALYELCDQSQLIRQTELPGRGEFWHNYALFLQGRGVFDVAIIKHQWALNELAAVYGFPSPKVVDAYDSMSQTLLAMGDLGSADSVAGLALKYSTDLGQAANDPAHWRIVNNAAAIKRALRLPVPARDLDYQAYVWRRDNLGAENAMTYASWMNHTLDLVELGAWEEAKAQFVTLYLHQKKGKPVPYPKEVLSYYLYYLDARLAFDKGEAFQLPPVTELARGGAPMELFAGVADLVVMKMLKEGDAPAARKMADWTAGLMERNLPENHPMRFEMALLQARSMAAQNPAAASSLVSATDLALYNWTRRQTLSGSYDASVAARVLADDLLLFMARHTQHDAGFHTYFADALNRWKTLESPSDRSIEKVMEADVAPDLKAAARAYGLAAARFRETVRAAPVSEDIAGMDAALRAQREALNPRLAENDLPLLEPPLAPLTHSEPKAIFVKPGDVLVDLMLLRDWTEPDRSGWSRRLVVSAAIHRNGTAPEIHEITTIDFTEKGDVYAGLWRDLGAWLFAASTGAERVFLVPDALLFQMDLLEARNSENRRFGEAFDVYMLSDRAAYAAHDTAATLGAGDRITLAGGLYYSAMAADDPSYLPGSLEEIEAVGALAISAGAVVARLSGFDGTVARVMAEAEASEVLHLATHGFFDDRSTAPYSLQNAGLVLSSAGVRAKAYAADVMNWDLSGLELVVLSACLSGVGKHTPIDAVRGLPLSLARAGALRSLVTLQEIPDRQTALIMQRFYSYLTKEELPYATAFLRTKRDIWAGRIGDVPPATAAAFVLYSH